MGNRTPDLFHAMDRKKDAMRRRGENISSQEVEEGRVSASGRKQRADRH